MTARLVLKFSLAIPALALMSACGGGGGNPPLQDTTLLSGPLGLINPGPFGNTLTGLVQSTTAAQTGTTTGTTTGTGTTTNTAGTGTTTTTSTTSQTPLSASSSGSTPDSILSGTGLRSSLVNGASALARYSGTLNTATDAISITDGTDTVNDPSGRDAEGLYEDSNSVLASGSIPTYEYVQIGAHAYTTSSGDVFLASLLYGIPSATSEIPSAGTATYNGEALVFVAPPTDAALLAPFTTGDVGPFTDGTALVSVDFGAGTADVTLANFVPIDATNGALATGTFDTVKLTGMTVSGTSFAGGTFETLQGTTTVDVVGANATHAARGDFFGFDAANGIPDEVAGASLTRGDSALVGTLFVAD